MADVPLDGAAILQHLVELADELAPLGDRHVVVVVGGSLLALHNLRDTTADVDSARRLDPELRDAVAVVGARHGLSGRWLNDSAATFRPVTFQEADCELLLERGRLTVLGAPLEQVFLMKLYAARAPDHDDLVTLWPRCTFDSPEQAVALFYAPSTRVLDSGGPTAVAAPKCAQLCAQLASVRVRPCQSVEREKP